MKLYYTVNSKQGDIQVKINQSLGGFKSGTPIQNSIFNNLFSDLSLFSLERDNNEYIGLIIINELESMTSNIKLWLENETNGYCKYRVAVVELSPINEMESIPTINSMPYFADFYEVPSLEEAINIPNMDIGDMFGLWIERSINVSSEAFINRNNPDYIIENPTTFDSKFEECKLKISFDGGN